MTQLLPSETVKYERYVDGVRRSDSRLLNLLNLLESEITSAIDGGEECRGRDAQLSEWAYKIGSAISRLNCSAEAAQTITIHIEGGMVQDVTGIPAGVTVRVEDYDCVDESAPTWDAEKECNLTVYEGGGV